MFRSKRWFVGWWVGVLLLLGAGCDDRSRQRPGEGPPMPESAELVRARAEAVRCQAAVAEREQQLTEERQTNRWLSGGLALAGVAVLAAFTGGALAGSKARKDGGG